MCGSLVRYSESMTNLPLSSVSRPMFSNPRPAVYGLRPMATRTTSASSYKKMLVVYMRGLIVLAYGLFLAALCSLKAKLDLLTTNITSHDLSVELKVNTLLLEDLL